MNFPLKRRISAVVGLVGLLLAGPLQAVELPARISTTPVVSRPKALPISAQPGLAPKVRVRLDAPDLSVVRAEDALASRPGPKGRSRVGIRRLLPEPVRLGAAKSGWTVLPDGSRVWSARLESEGAEGLRVHLESLHLPEGAELRVFNPDDPAEVLGPFDAVGLEGRGDFWTPSIFAAAVIVECRIPAGAAAASFRITELTHRYVRLGGDVDPKAGSSEAEPKTAAACHVDVSCEPSWATTSRAVAGIGSVGVIGELFCTGCLINDLNEAPKTDYFLTAAHCITSQSEADTAEFYWNYQTTACKGTPPKPSDAPRTVGGASILSTRPRNNGNDHCFLHLRGTVPAGVTYAGWNTDAPASGEALTGIHHPQGDYKRISLGVHQGENANYRIVRWTRGVTEVGSSGSPLFNARQQLVGQLFGGESDCSNADPSQQIDEYGRFNVTFPSVRRWLLNEAVVVPANDAFAAAASLSGTEGTIVGSTVNASREGGEPDHGQGGGRNSVWYRWTAPATGVVTFETLGSDFDTTLGVYQGDVVNALVRVVGNDDIEPGQTASRVGFQATAGILYRIAVDGRDGSQGTVRLAWRPGGTASPPLNDLFTNATVAVGFGGVYHASNRGYTREPLEPSHAGGGGARSAWWRWTAPISAPTVINTVDSGFDTLLAVYTGDAVSRLVRIADNDDIDSAFDLIQSEVAFDAVAGVTYRIAVDGFSDGLVQEEGTIRLDISQKGGTAGTNNLFANATLLTGTRGEVTGNNLGFTGETGEPSHGGVRANRSAWWRWTAPGDGKVRFETLGSAFDTLLAVYTGDTIGALKLVAENDDIISGDLWQSRLEFVAVKGTVYRIAVDGFYDAGPPEIQEEGNLRLAWEQTAAQQPQPPFTLTPSRTTDGRFQVRLASVSGIRYALERTRDVGVPVPQWTRLVMTDGNGSELFLADDTPIAGEAGYFRVVTVP